MSHPNDMSQWAEIGCQRGCRTHATTTVHVKLGGQTGYHDLTDIPARFAQELDIEVWDTRKTPVDGGAYCPARDAVSETILSHGIWEPQETTVLLCAFEAVGPDSGFIDFGSQLGWFSKLALESEMIVYALDADPDCYELTARNLGDTDHAIAAYGRVLADDIVWEPGFNGCAAEPWEPDGVVVKIDIEGAEAAAIQLIQPMIDAGRVKYLLIEISPTFNDSYPDLVVGLMDDGFVPYCLPPKQRPPVQIEHLSDLIPYQLVGTRPAVKAEVASWSQRDVFFALGGIE